MGEAGQIGEKLAVPKTLNREAAEFGLALSWQSDGSLLLGSGD